MGEPREQDDLDDPVGKRDYCVICGSWSHHGDEHNEVMRYPGPRNDMTSQTTQAWWDGYVAGHADGLRATKSLRTVMGEPEGSS